MTKKSLGFFSILALVVGTMVGVGILVAPTMMYKFGKYGFMAWPIASLLCLSLAFMFSKLSALVSASGPAGFAHEAFGNLASFQVSWAHWIGFTTAQALITYSFGQYVAPVFGQEYAFAISLAGLWTITILSSFFTIFSVSSALVLTSIKVGLLCLIIVAGLPYFDFAKISNIPSLVGSGYQALMPAISLCLLSFIGLEMATLPSENVKNAKVTVPMATLFGTLIAALLYTFSYAITGSVLSTEQLANTSRPMYDVANTLLGTYGGYLLVACAGLGFFASINGVLFAQSYIVKYTSEIKILPKFFNKETKAGFPFNAAFLSSVVSTIGLSLITHDRAWMSVFGSFSGCFVSIVYLWSVISFRHLGGNVILWAINFLTAMTFLVGSLDISFIPSAVLVYAIGFFVYGLFVTNKKLSAF